MNNPNALTDVYPGGAEEPRAGTEPPGKRSAQKGHVRAKEARVCFRGLYQPNGPGRQG